MSFQEKFPFNYPFGGIDSKDLKEQWSRGSFYFWKRKIGNIFQDNEYRDNVFNNIKSTSKTTNSKNIIQDFILPKELSIEKHSLDNAIYEGDGNPVFYIESKDKNKCLRIIQEEFTDGLQIGVWSTRAKNNRMMELVISLEPTEDAVDFASELIFLWLMEGFYSSTVLKYYDIKYRALLNDRF